MKSIIINTVLIFHFTILDAVRFRCDYRYTDLGWFKYHEVPLVWYDAFLQCKLEGGILASPTSTGIKSVMMESICNNDIFTGIHATFSKGQYYSVDGIPLSQIPHEWAWLEPNNINNSENCIAFSIEGKFSDVRCDEPRPFICYRQHSNVDVSVCGTPDPEYFFETRTNKCYKFHTKPKRFPQAHFTCSAEGGHLAIINSNEELKVIQELHARYPPALIKGHYDKNSAFLGFYYTDESADWITIHGETLQEAGFDKFVPGQPDNSTSSGEYCGGVYRNNLLNDVSCDKRFAFICEKRPDYPAVCDNVVRNISHYNYCKNYNQGQDRQIYNLDVRSSD